MSDSLSQKKAVWNEYHLDEVFTFASGLSKSRDDFGFGFPFLSFKEVFNNFFLPENLENLANTTEKERSSCSIKKGDVFLTRTSETQEELGMSSVALMDYPEATFNGFTKRLRPIGNIAIYPEYSGYYFRSPKFRATVTSMSSMTTRASLNNEMMAALKIILPDFSEQKAIAAVLSCLDDKIDLLHRQNKTLEAMAETLFKQWFVVEAREDWEEKPLGDVAIVQNGFAFSSKDYVEYQDGHLEVFKMGHIKPGGGLRFSPKADYVPRIEKLERWTLKQDDIVMAMTDMKDSMGILGHPAMIDISNKYVLNQRVARIYLENSNNLLSNYFLYLQLNTDDAIALLQSKANSGVQVNLSTEAIRSLPLIIPPKEVQNQALKSLEPMLKKALVNRKSIKNLETLRDNLLPKLMSGDVRVNLISQSCN